MTDLIRALRARRDPLSDQAADEIERLTALSWTSQDLIIDSLSRQRNDALVDADKWMNRYEEEYRIVDRVWKALGNPSYESLNGQTIDQVVSAAIAERDAAVRDTQLLRGSIEEVLRCPAAATEPCQMCMQTLRDAIDRAIQEGD